MLLTLLQFNSFLIMIKYSIIICSYNRFELLSETIDSILSVLINRVDYEILIIDNKSTDPTPSLEEKFNTNKNVKYFLETKQGLSHARNRGMIEATGEILVYLDDDVELINNYFEVADNTLNDKSISIFGGKVLPFKTEIPKWLPTKYFYLVSIFDLGNNVQIVDNLMGANYAMKKEIAKEVGFYNTELGRKGDNLMGGEENDYFDRAKKIGCKIIYNPELIVLHKINSKLNKKYVLDYSYLNGKSSGVIQKKSNVIKYILKIFKSLIMIFTYYLFGFYQKNEKRKTLYQINKLYSFGYLSSFRVFFHN